MERLTDKELLDALNEHEKDCCRCRERICTYESDRYNCLQDKDKKAYKELAEYRRLEEQGLLLKLPCKVGDKVYLVDYEEGEYDEAVVDKIYLDSDGICIDSDYEIGTCVDSDYVFFSEEAARLALTLPEMEG